MMWSFLWAIFSLVVVLSIFLKPAHAVDEGRKWAKLPTLTPTHFGSALPGSKLPTLTPTPATVSDWPDQWPVEVKSVPIQALPPGFPSVLPGSATPPPPVPPTPVPLPAGPLLGLPVKGPISQGFGCSPYYTGIAGPGCSAEQPWFHDGLDIEAVVDTPVTAMMAGVVIFAGTDTSGPKCDDDRGYGLAVVVDSGSGWRTLYAHLAAIRVSSGQMISAETIIGTVGTSGCATGPHLHFGLRYNDSLMDPQGAISGQRVLVN